MLGNTEIFSSSPTRVLVVDDEPHAAHSLCMLLRRKGHEADATLSGESALGWVGRSSPDLMLVDLIMPKMHGIEVARAVRRMTLPKEPVLVAWSGYTSPRVKRECAEAGFDQFLPKASAIDVLHDLIELMQPSTGNQRLQGVRAQFKAAAQTFAGLQLEFCELVLDTLPNIRDRDVRQKQVLRAHRSITQAAVWLIRQRDIPEDAKRDAEQRIAVLRTRLALYHP